MLKRLSRISTRPPSMVGNISSGIGTYTCTMNSPLSACSSIAVSQVSWSASIPEQDATAAVVAGRLEHQSLAVLADEAAEELEPPWAVGRASGPEDPRPGQGLRDRLRLGAAEEVAEALVL